MKIQNRQSNMELLRIFSIILIVVFHCVHNSGFQFPFYFSINKFICKCFMMFGKLGVNLFILISGYFMIDSNFKIKKLLLLAFQVWFYWILTVFIALKLNILEITDTKTWILYCFPIILRRYWFVTAYILLYILSPYLNIFALQMKQNEYRKFLILTIFIWSVIPTIFGIFYNGTESLLYYSRIIWFMIIYLIGAYIKKYSLSFISTPQLAHKTIIISSCVIITSILLIEKFETFFQKLGTSEIAYFWHQNTLPMLFLSIGVFGIFYHIKIPFNPYINKLASTTLGIYLLHDGVLWSWIWRTKLNIARFQESSVFIFYIFGGAFLVLIICGIIELIRQIIEKYTIQKVLNAPIMNHLLYKFEKYISEIKF